MGMNGQKTVAASLKGWEGNGVEQRRAGIIERSVLSPLESNTVASNVDMFRFCRINRL